MKPQPELLECTLRDGSYAIDFQFTARDTETICTALDAAGFKFIEIGHGFGLGASSEKFGIAAASDRDYLMAAARGCRKAKFGAFFIPGVGKADDIRLAADCGMGFIRIGTNVSRHQEAAEFIRLAKNLGMMVAYNAMKSYASAPTVVSAAFKAAETNGADVVYIVDSAGCMLPSEVSAYVGNALSAVKIPVGFHGHDNLSMAAANSIAAIDSGATYVDSTLQGMGRSGGNAQTEVMLVLLEKLGYSLAIDLQATINCSTHSILPIMPRESGITELDMTLGQAMFHSSYLPLIMEAAAHYNISTRPLILEVSKAEKENPTRDLVFQIAKQISTGETDNI